MGEVKNKKSVVKVSEVEPGIALVVMEDRETKNRFSQDLVTGMFDAYNTIQKNENFKVVILTGYENYFSTGATQKALLDMQGRKLSFYEEKNDENVMYSWGIDCSLPVIAAMQGHGIGGGFIMGIYCDIVILGRECVYTTNFMNYGFTPGMGSTFILPEKLGIPLTEELFFGGKTYRGADLEKRGIPFKVVPKNQVLEEAMELARRIAEKPRISLITLKDHLIAHIRDNVMSKVDKERIMHEKTFHNPEVKERILRLYKTE